MAAVTLADFQTHGLPEQTVWEGDWNVVSVHVAAAVSDILEALRSGGYDEPIPDTSWTPSMKRNACIIAGYHFLRRRGWQAQSAEDAEFIEAYRGENGVLAWMKGVAKGAIKPLPVNAAGQSLDAKPETEPNGAGTIAEERRGWGATWP